MRTTKTSGRVAANWRAAVCLSLLAGMATGCPDPEGRFEGFLEQTQDEREEAMNQKLDIGGALADVSGTHFFALAPGFSMETPLQFTVQATFTPEGEGGVLDLDLQPLKVRPDDPSREPVGEIIEIRDVPVDASGAFTIDLGEVTVTGDANPISGSEIVGVLTLTGAIQSTDLFCGTVAGALSKPAALPLDNSTFAAVRIEDTAPAALPETPVTACPADGGDTTNGDTGGATTGGEGA